MVNLDAIRSNARQLAWQSYDGQSRNYNPFARTARGPNRRPGDEEALDHVQTADSAPSAAETQRRERYVEDYPPPNRAGTEPPASAINGRPHQNGLPRDMDIKEKPYAEPGSPTTSGETSHPSQYVKDEKDDTTATPRTNSETAGPRKRKLGNLFKKKSKTDKDEDHSDCLLYTSPSPRDGLLSRMPSSA